MHNQNVPISNMDLPQRPPSVSLPSIGQEGNEYADIGYKEEPSVTKPEGSGNEPQETRNVGSDLPLHAPRPSFSNSTAKARVATVTRTDSTQAAAVGIGKASSSVDDKDPQDRILKPRVSFRTASSASTERPGSAQPEDDRGIPEIGQRVPMYPDAGDVQAPSPSPFQQQLPAGVGFHNSGIQKPPRHHRRTPSGREILPPGSYGMHGHGVPSTDHFEKTWYEKHPEALEREEHGQYGPGIGGSRGEWALSSDDLNKLVRETSSKQGQGCSDLHLSNVISAKDLDLTHLDCQTSKLDIWLPKNMPLASTPQRLRPFIDHCTQTTRNRTSSHLYANKVSLLIPRLATDSRRKTRMRLTGSRQSMLWRVRLRMTSFTFIPQPSERAKSMEMAMIRLPWTLDHVEATLKP